MIILGIETSCDETAAAIIEGRGDKVKVLSNIVSSQIEIHKKYGGVVPEVAAREHVVNILPVINQALEKADLTPALSLPRRGGFIDTIAVTVGPGLITSLLVGVETAKTLAYVWRIPVVAVNHIEGHVYANFIDNKPKFPALILTVSGGHTMLILMSGHGKYKVLGQTRDDAAGEAFDKAAMLLGLGYPGGPAIAAEAAKLRITNYELRINKLPRPMMNSNNFDFSFSGLKTALLYATQRDKNWKKKISEYAYEFEQAVAEVLVHKTLKAALKYNCKNIMLSGGVAANKELRSRMGNVVKEKSTGAKLIIPDFKYCTDNAAMIAAAGYFQAKRKKLTPWRKLKAEANQELK
ncbi:MAG: tRNA (adenosine(37)-N6)-threonylcarbamoyltransferase complex transferase subunit TsaD [Patescibacteria group bacterium]|jgi:N6-L-threonylcarbamoyladenine synthase